MEKGLQVFHSSYGISRNGVMGHENRKFCYVEETQRSVKCNDERWLIGLLNSPVTAGNKNLQSRRLLRIKVTFEAVVQRPHGADLEACSAIAIEHLWSGQSAGNRRRRWIRRYPRCLSSASQRCIYSARLSAARRANTMKVKSFKHNMYIKKKKKNNKNMKNQHVKMI